jgi:hypothetical protein
MTKCQDIEHYYKLLYEIQNLIFYIKVIIIFTLFKNFFENYN